MLSLTRIPKICIPHFCSVTRSNSIRPGQPSMPGQVLQQITAPVPTCTVNLIPCIRAIRSHLAVRVQQNYAQNYHFYRPKVLAHPTQSIRPRTIVSTVRAKVQGANCGRFSLLSLDYSSCLTLPTIKIRMGGHLGSRGVSLSLPDRQISHFSRGVTGVINNAQLAKLAFTPRTNARQVQSVVGGNLAGRRLLRNIGATRRRN